MPILRLTQEEAGDEIYKTLKKEIIELFGPREEDSFKKAMALRLDGKPSALGKKLIHIWCPGAKPFNNCHCSKVMFGFWEAQMPPAIKCRIAGMKFNKDTYQEIFKLADETWIANGGSTTKTPAVVGATKVNSASDSSSSSSAPQVSATSRGGGRGGGRGNFRGNQRGGRGGGRGGSAPGGNNNNSRQNQSSNSSNSNQTQQGPKAHQRGPKASPDVPADACARHWKEGRNATYCSDPLVCSWSHIIVPRK